MRALVQLALDLWGDAPAALPGATPKYQQKPPETLASQAPPATEKVAPAAPVCGPETLDAVLAPAVLLHPRANRHVRLQGAHVAYLLQRARRRSIGLRVDGEGLSVRAPTAASVGAIEAALHAKAEWIVRKLAEQGDHQRRLESARIDWRDGANLPFLGEPLVLVLDPGYRVASRGGARLVLPGAGGGGLGTEQAGTVPPAPAPSIRQLHVPLAHGASPSQLRDAVQAWLQHEARQHFTARLEHFAALLDVRWTRLSLSSARSRWGSARADGSIRLNWRLMHYSPALIDYVVAHELAHLRVMDHSPRFWDTVASVVPDHAALRRRLREQPAPPWE